MTQPHYLTNPITSINMTSQVPHSAQQQTKLNQSKSLDYHFLTQIYFENAFPSSSIMGELRGWSDGGDGGPTGTNREAGVGECGGDIQREHMLHVPRDQEAVLRNGSEPHGARVGRGPQRKRPRESTHEAPRFSLCCPCRFHWWQTCRHYG